MDMELGLAIHRLPNNHCARSMDIFRHITQLFHTDKPDFPAADQPYNPHQPRYCTSQFHELMSTPVHKGNRITYKGTYLLS